MFTGTPPFGRGGKIELACQIVLEDERPPRPRDSEKLGFTDKVWENLRKCWEKNPSARPPIDEVSACLRQAAETWVADVPAFVLACEAGVGQVAGVKGDQTKEFVDKLDEVLSRGIQRHPPIGVLTPVFNSRHSIELVSTRTRGRRT